MIPVRMLTKTARWLTLTTGFHPIQRAPSYDRSSLTGGTHCRMATSECRIGKHRPIPVGALPTDAQARHHQGAGAEESDSQEEGQNEDCHENLYQARR